MNQEEIQLNQAIIDAKLLDDLVEQSLNQLKKDRDREVLMKRHGINGLDHQTLERIGGEFGITRERVRQVEKAALSRIATSRSHDNALNIAMSDILNRSGGLIGFSNLLNQLRIDNDTAARMRFLVKTDPSFIFIDSNDQHDNIVLLDKIYSVNDLRNLHNQIVEIVKSGGKPVRFEQIYKRIDGPHSKNAIAELAAASRLLSELDSNWGLAQWPEVNPRSIRDKVYIILKKAGRPMHFTEIARKISDIQANPKKVTTQAVHNELIKDPRFILIGRGIYALSEWGYQAGTVADIIEEILREESPLSKEEIVKRVLARRQVKVTTIVLNLQEKDQFERVGKAIYRLKTTKTG